MFRSATIHLAHRVSDLIDDMLVGDFEYVFDGREVYADVDYFRRHPHHVAELTWTPAAGRGFASRRSQLRGPTERRPGVVPSRPAVCLSPVRSSSGRPATAAARSRAHR